MNVKHNGMVISVEQAIWHWYQEDISCQLLAKLIGTLCTNGHIKTYQLQEMLGDEYEVSM